MKVSIKSLGCKINQFDSGVLRERLLAGGATIAGYGDAADVYVINTCTVTKKSDYHCRQAIRKAVRNKPEGGLVVVTGCYAQASPEEILEMPGVDYVVGNGSRDSLPGIILGRVSDAAPAGPLCAETVQENSRAFLKVQEGCDSRCSYCIVPSTRGSARSAPAEDVLMKAGALIEKGYHEIVLTGVHLGSYGKDGEVGLAGLVGRLLALPGLGRLRLSSVEPTEFDEVLMDIIASEAGGRLCRHFHVPLQSADDQVLSSMGRNYDAEWYFGVIDRLHALAPGSCLGADVIVGYPAEDSVSFERTLAAIEKSKLNYLHVFSYSPRPGTAACGLGDPVPGDEKARRSRALRELAASKNMTFRESFVGRQLDVVVEDRGGAVSGLTDNYIRVGFDGMGLAPRSAVTVRILEAGPDICSGVVI